MITKDELDYLVKTYEVRTFTNDDPSQFLRKYKNENDIEITSFIAALFAFGKREAFIQKLNEIFDKMGNSPYNFLLTFDENKKPFKNFKYRFIKEEDLNNLILCLKKLYSEKKSLNPDTVGFKHLFPNPKKGSALKRYFMFLRWMVRDGDVDLGLWNFIPKSKLLIPMDTHVIQQAKKMGLINNPKADFKSAIELTNVLKTFDPKDPAKYDFALFGYGIEND